MVNYCSLLAFSSSTGFIFILVVFSHMQYYFHLQYQSGCFYESTLQSTLLAEDNPFNNGSLWRITGGQTNPLPKEIKWEQSMVDVVSRGSCTLTRQHVLLQGAIKGLENVWWPFLRELRRQLTLVVQVTGVAQALEKGKTSRRVSEKHCSIGQNMYTEGPDLLPVVWHVWIWGSVSSIIS